MRSRFDSEFEEMENRLKEKIKDLEEQIKRLSSNSELSNAEWL